MTKVISAFEAPALLDAHPTLTRYELYERLTGAPEAKGPVGLATCLSDGVMRFAQSQYGWSTPINKAFEKSTDSGINAISRGFVAEEEGEPILVVFLHLADYLHRMSWGKSGTPPRAFIIQANWTMWLADQQRLTFLVLSDKRLVLYEVQRDQEIIDQLAKAIDDMAHAIENKSPPPVDAKSVPETPRPATSDDDAPPVDRNELVRRWREATNARAETANTATFADHAAEAATTALKDALPKGEHHDFDGFRIHHNAKTGRLTEEKIDGHYF